jgi:clan AA aspartic protease (TIGR02281 family)
MTHGFLIVKKFHFLPTFDFQFVHMRFLFSIAFFFLGLNTIVAQDVVKMEKENGVYKIPCKINGLPLKFIFDTGASSVSISLTEALFMLKNGYLKESDIRGTIYYSIANGEIAEGTKINLQKIEVGKQILYNVEASIVHTSQAPLLFGQSAMERFGKFTMDYSNANLLIGNASNTTSNTTSAAAIKSVKIGTQTWMSENLNVSTFRNGDPIPEAKSIEEWKQACENKQPIWCFYEFDSKNEFKYGKLYNYWVLSDKRNISPYGWKLPLAKDFELLLKKVDPKTSISPTDMFDSLNGVNNNFHSLSAGESLKSINGWEISILYPDKLCGQECNGNNLSGFNAKPSSYIGSLYNSRSIPTIGFGKKDCCYIWAANIDLFDTAYGYEIYIVNKHNQVSLSKTQPFDGLSIRCLKE